MINFALDMMGLDWLAVDDDEAERFLRKALVDAERSSEEEGGRANSLVDCEGLWIQGGRFYTRPPELSVVHGPLRMGQQDDEVRMRITATRSSVLV